MGKDTRLSADERTAMDRAILAAEEALRHLRTAHRRHLLDYELANISRDLKALARVRSRIHGGGAS